MKQYKVTKKIGKRFVPGDIVDELTYGRFAKDVQQSSFIEVAEESSKKSQIKVPQPKVVKTEEIVEQPKSEPTIEPKQVSRWKKETE